jgi:phosphatidylinositol-3-phosphatase
LQGRRRRGSVVSSQGRNTLRLVAVLAVALAMSLIGAGQAKALPAVPCGGTWTPATPKPATYKHIIWIWFENKSFGDIIGNTAQAPYLNALAEGCGLATSFYNETHKSTQNYLAAASGYPKGAFQPTLPSVFGQGIFWKTYAESMTTNCQWDNTGKYVRGHNSPVWFGAIKSLCDVYDVPMGSCKPYVANWCTGTPGALYNDLYGSNFPQFAQIIPNSCHMMHQCLISAGDNFLRIWIPYIMNRSFYKDGSTIVIITFDEGQPFDNVGVDCLTVRTEDCHIPTVVVSPYLNGVKTSRFYSHYSMLKSLEENFRLPLLGHAADSTTENLRVGFGL